ncbi:MAG TPA: hypothetical protein VGB26_06490 [Nitrospiria bacterium]|jgi:hypothetical protein
MRPVEFRTFVFLFIILMVPSTGFSFHYGDRVSPVPVSVELITGVQERDIVEKSEDLVDPCCKFKGDAVSSRLLARLGIEAFHRVELFGLFGGVGLSIDEFGGFDSNLNMTFGGGARFILYEAPFPQASHIFLEYSYLQFDAEDRVEISKCSNPNASSNCSLSTATFVGTVQDDEIKWREHVVKIGGDSRVGYYRPYGGIRFSLVRGDEHFSLVSSPSVSDPGFNPNIRSASIEEDDFFGVFGGVDFFLDPSDSLVLNIEVNLFDVNSIQGGLRFKF